MNPDTGHLVADLNSVDFVARRFYKSVPELLTEFAENELAGRQETMVNLRRRNELTRWAKAEKAKNRARNKVAKKSRTKNR